MWWLIAERGQSKIAEAVMAVGTNQTSIPF